MRAQTVLQALMLPPWRFLGSLWPWRSLGFVVSSAILAPVLIAILVPTILLLPLWGIALAWLDRRRLTLLGLPRPASGHVRVPPGERQNWLGVRLTEPATWRETLSLLLGIVFGAASLAIVGMQGLVIAAGVTMVGMAKRGELNANLFSDIVVTLGPENWWQPIPVVLLALPVFAYVNGLLAALHGGCVRWLIAPRIAEIDERVIRLTRSRAAIVAANEAERRRLERDLHDGVQQELVAIAARLGILELELAHGDDAARVAALDAAQRQTERALAALRDTVRGIHPAVLSDHGLAAALTELGARSAIPLRVDDRGFPRLSAECEAAAYFFVAEAVTNAAKHTSAPFVRVELSTRSGRAVVEASDAGHGGIAIERGGSRGSGLRGLAERADALGGSLTVRSPVGGPTRLTLSLPLATELSFPGPENRKGAEAHADPARR